MTDSGNKPGSPRADGHSAFVEDDYVALAEVARPHGIRGELRLKVYNPDSDVLQRQRRIRLVPKDGEPRMVRIKAARPVPGTLLVKLEGVNDRNAAELLRGARFEVPRNTLEAIEDEDEHYVVDLIGNVVMLAGEPIGVVSDVASYPTCDALVVKRSGQPRLEVPMQGAYVESIEDGVITLSSIDGL